MINYGSVSWKQKRKHILVRDGYIDRIALRDGVRMAADTVHHILPAEDYPEYAWEDWNLISVSARTHRTYLHDPRTKALTPLGLELARQTAEEHGVKLTEKVLVVGLPGTGKSTWTKEHLGGGLAYDLDALAAAFRLTSPKSEEHAAARRLAAALRQSFSESALEYSPHIFVIRSAPSLDEVIDFCPDKIVVMTKQHKTPGYSYDKKGMQQAIDDIIEYATLNRIPLIVNQ